MIHLTNVVHKTIADLSTGGYDVLFIDGNYMWKNIINNSPVHGAHIYCFILESRMIESKLIIYQRW